MPLGAKIKELRKEQGLSQGELGKISGIHEKLISKYEHERIIPTADTLKKIAQALRISADYLIFDNTPKEGKAELKDVELFSMFKEVENMGEEERETIKNLIDAMIVKAKVQKAVKPEAQDLWSTRMRRVLARFRKGAEGYSEEEIMRIVDEAVEAVRREERQKRKAS
jgi:transcriptional regulator with XRE-family HTH domain